ncbi:MAG: 5-dehydro-4-deoxy-D-glucuronate isomerase [Cytophagales bacterium]|nr:5-dehydro-4-deoxy-D-glucuronate isomerase [Cytophagales bacterium]MDW8383436.1 5-dehydro-4-deoxy-D-glucuronate isomerase [Flammeovirgaceae bacterium]
MEVRYAANPIDAKHYTTERLRKDFLIENIFVPDEFTSVYSLYDRIIVIGAMPVNKTLTLPAFESLTRAEYFLERRELGIFNIGGQGVVTVDGTSYELAYKDCLYIGQGNKVITFASKDKNRPAEFYMNSCPAHKSYPTVKMTKAEATNINLGDQATANKRSIFQYIHENGIQSCQLVMGFTELHPGNVWNTFPPHTHMRRMEVYFYFEIPENQIVMHFMGEPTETRNIVVRNKQAVISPEWSIHCGAGTSNYTFIWGMCGENKTYTDMDPAGTNILM